ncbi:hypothetical protein [Tessaracoccus coleopterorum]|nr:hypothetical protein [Tessaracoccus coleopterorum]
MLSEKPPTLSLAEYDEIAAHEGDNGPSSPTSSSTASARPPSASGS